MALPSGYKQLEYIKSSGDQYVDTGFNPNQTTSIYVEAELLEASSYPTIFGARNWDQNMYWMYNNGNGVISDTFITRFNSTSYSLKSEFGAKQIYSIDSGIAKVGSISTPISISNFQSQYSMFLFAANNAGKVQYPSKMNLYSCKIYDNGALIRFYIPCKTSSGEIGLWDDVNSVFYGNAGTGAFTAGPVVAVIPDHPSNLHQTMAVRLAWAAVSGAELYNVYRDGTLLATTTDLAYVDDTAAENTEYTYGVSAVNSAGESPKTTLTVYTKSGYFMYKPVVESATFQ